MNLFWLAPSQWPRDPSGFVFLARAVHEIGQTIMKDEWTGSEPTTEHIPCLPTTFGLGQYPPHPHHLERAHRLLMNIAQSSTGLLLSGASGVRPPSHFRMKNGKPLSSFRNKKNSRRSHMFNDFWLFSTRSSNNARRESSSASIVGTRPVECFQSRVNGGIRICGSFASSSARSILRNQ